MKIFNHQDKNPSILAHYVNKTSKFIEKSSNTMDFTDHTKIPCVLLSAHKMFAGFYCYNFCVALGSYKAICFRVPGQQADSSPGTHCVFPLVLSFPRLQVQAMTVLCKKHRLMQSLPASHDSWLMSLPSRILISLDLAQTTPGKFMQPIQEHNVQFITSLLPRYKPGL